MAKPLEQQQFGTADVEGVNIRIQLLVISFASLQELEADR